MAAQDEIRAPDWVFPGARVVTYLEKNGNISQVQIDTVIGVGQKWITLKKLGFRVNVRTLETANQAAGGYGVAKYRLVKEYSEEGQQILRDGRIRNRTGHVARAFAAWQRNPTGETERANLRTALDRLDNVIEKD